MSKFFDRLFTVIDGEARKGTNLISNNAGSLVSNNAGSLSYWSWSVITVKVWATTMSSTTACCYTTRRCWYL